MNLLRREEKLESEDGKISANVLPLDRSASRIEYETATFGVG